VLLAAVLAGYGVGCNRPAPPTASTADAAGASALSVRVPAALTLARALDTLWVGVDPASLATTQVTVDPGMVLGVETDVVVFPQGGARPAEGRHRYSSGTDFDVGTDTWSTAHDGIPDPAVKYVAEMQLVLFETDVPAGHAAGRPWDPHAGKYMALWTRTLRQAEE
jgi:hypothetical protein